MTPFVQIESVDSNSNRDLDFTSEVIGSPDGGATLFTTNAVDGVAEFSSLIFTERGTGINLTFGSTGYINLVSLPFDVIEPYVNIAIQDFDNGVPTWNYTQNVAFFDNGWGVEGFYGPINTALAAPLDFPLFNNNILGENDLQDTENGNGTSGFARITLDNVDVTGLTGVKLMFDWQVKGYAANRNDVRYRVILDGVAQDIELLFDGNGIPEDGQGREIIDIGDDVNTVRFWIEVRNNRIDGYSGIDNLRLVRAFDGLVFSEGSWSPNAPDLTTGSQDALIGSGNYNLSPGDDNVVVNKLIIRPNASMTVEAGKTVETNDAVLNGGTLTLNSTSSAYSSIIPTTVENNGVINYNRYVNSNSSGNDLIAFPLQSTTLGEFVNMGDPNNGSKLFENIDQTLYLFGPFDQSTNRYINYSQSATEQTLNIGVGYRAATTIGEPLTFTGNIETDNIAISVNPPSGGTPWNLIGNPFPSYVDAQALISDNIDLFDPAAVAIYGYNAGTGSPNNEGTDGNFTIINFLVNTNINIAPGQGFYVAVKNESFPSPPFFNIQNTNRTLVGNDDFIGSRSATEEPSYVKLKLSKNNGESKFTDIYFTDNASLNLDPGYDAAVWSIGSSDFNLFSQLVGTGSITRPMAIQALPKSALEESRVPLGVNAEAGQQISFSISDVTIDASVDVYLEDALTNNFTKLNTNDYTITPTSNLSGTGRFYLTFSNNALSNSEYSLADITVYTNSDKSIIIKTGQHQLQNITVTDIQGRLVTRVSTQGGTGNQYVINAKTYNSGIYMISMTTDSGTLTKKIILN